MEAASIPALLGGIPSDALRTQQSRLALAAVRGEGADQTRISSALDLPYLNRFARAAVVAVSVAALAACAQVKSFLPDQKPDAVATARDALSRQRFS